MKNLFAAVLFKFSRLLLDLGKIVEKSDSKNIIPEVKANEEDLNLFFYKNFPELSILNIIESNTVPPKVALLLPSLISSGFYGGVATALIVGAKIAVLTKRSLLVIETFVSGGSDINRIKNFYIEKGIDINGLNIDILDLAKLKNLGERCDLISHTNDLFIASAWSDAYSLINANLNNRFLYLIQDFEPIFYPNSDKYLLAENTYRGKEFVPICNTHLMHEYMHGAGYTQFKTYAYWFEPAASNLPSGIIRNNSKRVMFLYGRPSVARNLFYSALISLKHVFENHYLIEDEWEIYMAGQDDLPSLSITENLVIKNLGKMNIDDYVKFSKGVDLAISLMMAPHPNYPTLEFASIGSAVVTTKYAVKNSLSNYSKNIHMAELTIKSLVDNIVEAANINYDKRIDALAYNSINSDWNEALDDVLNAIITEFSQLK